MLVIWLSPENNFPPNSIRNRSTALPSITPNLITQKYQHSRRPTGIIYIILTLQPLNRRKSGLSQDKLAELAGISSQYLATVETCRKFPTPEVLDRLAEALNIETHELFTSAPTPQDELEKLRQNIIGEVVKAIKQSFAEERKTNK